MHVETVQDTKLPFLDRIAGVFSLHGNNSFLCRFLTAKVVYKTMSENFPLRSVHFLQKFV